MVTTLPVADDTAAFPAAKPATLSPEDSAALAQAVHLLEHRSFAARLTALLGREIEVAKRLLPQALGDAARQAVTMALRASLRIALKSLVAGTRPPAPRLHRGAVMLSGAVGGAFGLAALPIELPVSTTLMLRAIADVARAEGEHLSTPEASLACLQVFALGGRMSGDEHIEGGYFAIRGVLARGIAEAAAYLTERGFAEAGGPAGLRLIAQIAARFGVVLSEKLALQAVPILGAVGGAAINAAFMEHFVRLARGHFTVRRLERIYGSGPIRAAYEALRTPHQAS